jgi:plastocyanin
VIVGLLAALLAAVAWPAAAGAKERTFTLRYGPVALSGFQTRYPQANVQTPKRAGYIVRMSTRVVDGRGHRVPLRRVMLHHVVFVNHGRPGGPARTSTCPGRAGEPFFGTGEENQRLVLPRGYGYRVGARDRWRMITMLMSHRLEYTRVWVEYRVTMETSRRLTPVRPLWLRANGCNPLSSYDVPGGGAPGSIDRRSTDWVMPISGRIVAAGAHLHGSTRGMTITQPRCGNRTLIDHRPRWGMPDDAVYRLRPVLHEPGPIATGYWLSRRGIPVRRGEVLRVTGRYDAQLPHPAVMAIAHVYVARDDGAATSCHPLPPDRTIHWTRHVGRDAVTPSQIPLTALDGAGRLREIARSEGPGVVAADAATVDLTRSLFSPPNLSIALNGTVTWRSLDIVHHAVMLANGPRSVNSPIMGRGGIFVQRFEVPGTYNLFCYLHPVTMHETLVVRPDPAPAAS